MLNDEVRCNKLLGFYVAGAAPEWVSEKAVSIGNLHLLVETFAGG